MGISPEVGEPICWVPAAFTEHNTGVGWKLGAADRLSGRIVYVDLEHRFYRVEAACEGGVLHECFKF